MIWDFEMEGNGQNRYVIVNADDFGQSLGVNRGIMEAHECGIVTAASLLVRWPAAADAARYAREHPCLSLGLHFDLWEWTCRRGEWLPLYELVAEDDWKAARREASRQLTVFLRLTGKDPTHLDSHQHAHRRASLRPVFTEISAELNVPLRSFSPQIRYCGDFYGQSDDGRPCPDLISVNHLIKILGELPPGFTELSCHPGYTDGLRSSYRRERVKEVKTLCDPNVRRAIADMGIKLCSFSDQPAARVSGGLQ